jgi:hypothetical protein
MKIKSIVLFCLTLYITNVYSSTTIDDLKKDNEKTLLVKALQKPDIFYLIANFLLPECHFYIKPLCTSLYKKMRDFQPEFQTLMLEQSLTVDEMKNPKLFAAVIHSFQDLLVQNRGFIPLDMKTILVKSDKYQQELPYGKGKSAFNAGYNYTMEDQNFDYVLHDLFYMTKEKCHLPRLPICFLLRIPRSNKFYLLKMSKLINVEQWQVHADQFYLDYVIEHYRDKYDKGTEPKERHVRIVLDLTNNGYKAYTRHDDHYPILGGLYWDNNVKQIVVYRSSLEIFFSNKKEE